MVSQEPIFVDIYWVQRIFVCCEWLGTAVPFVACIYGKFALSNTEKAVFGRDFNRSEDR
jgi:hypothetical protein